ncbi:uncharacterized protein CANTADRAFT_3950 [Suhomyces tanzawaensis NRRL Y-17324]|uniref:Magnesium transporter n=1 Tax=Suhomyces tanzawaensis NRRL Y-17324 TaxID=984487 RepID=A0A1E4SR62_9ASCO|nr:uncharacterized protein CANTADRAFT_3950 [Suhomyces tanzawaensis NRRL Y-17324]ODV81892.1 hypothetical protein CANTADRAFT_3950 [Suhomyces tanzawaensis NRRL Y-17324]
MIQRVLQRSTVAVSTPPVWRLLVLPQRGYASKNTGAKPSRDEPYSDLFLTKSLSNKSFDSGFIRCTTFDNHGTIVHHGKDIRKVEFMKTHNLVARDFRKISRHLHAGGNSAFFDMVPSIVTRSDSILLNLLNVRAMIKKDMVAIFDSSSYSTGGGRGSRLNESRSQSMFFKDLSERLAIQGDELPYEFRAMEAVLVHVMTNLTTEMNVHIRVLQNILNGLEDNIDRVRLRYLLIESKKIAQFHQKVLLIRDLLNDIIDNDDELNDFHLTDILKGQPRTGTDHAEIEFLLESYYKTSDEIVQTVQNLKSQIKTTEEIINMVLDSNRNELMLLGLKFSTGLLSTGIALYVSALYGMNLENFIEECDGGFELVVVVGSVLFVALLLFSVNKLKNLQKVTMTGVHREGRFKK